MPLRPDPAVTPQSLRTALDRLFDLAGPKIRDLDASFNPAHGTPVFTVQGRYTSRGWTEWTQGFQFGAALLQFEATSDTEFLDLAWRGTRDRMAPHVSHTGVHDHGFNNVSTYGNLLRLHHEGRLPPGLVPPEFCRLALQVSGAIQASRWTRLADGSGFIHSFNGPHSLFVDTVRSLRVLALAHHLGHVLMGEQDARISLLHRLLDHARNTARYNVYYGEERDIYDLPGRTAHEAVFNVVSGVFRCPNSQQGYSPFTTWTRGLAWAILGFAEQLEYLQAHPPTPPPESFADTLALLHRAAQVTADFYLHHCCSDGIPFWDTGAPHLHRLPENRLDLPSDPGNPWEPVDSSAAAIAAQGFLRLARVLANNNQIQPSLRYRQAGLTLTRTLLQDPYLSTQPQHQGLLLHSVYHRPNGWDHVPAGQKIPRGESSQWGDYHLLELAVLVLREARGDAWPAFFHIGPPL